MLKVYESIIELLEEKGPLPISKICTEVNQMLDADRDGPLLPSQIKSIVTRKRDLFLNKDGNISIQPDKQPLHLILILDGEEGITYRVNVNFTQKRFTFFEWRNKGIQADNNAAQPKQPGDFAVFKREIFALKLWEWRHSYGKEEGIILGATNWKLKLVTECKTYVSEGTDCYPGNWHKFCKAIEKLTGSVFQLKI